MEIEKIFYCQLTNFVMTLEIISKVWIQNQLLIENASFCSYIHKKKSKRKEWILNFLFCNSVSLFLVYKN